MKKPEFDSAGTSIKIPKVPETSPEDLHQYKSKLFQAVKSTTNVRSLQSSLSLGFHRRLVQFDHKVLAGHSEGALWGSAGVCTGHQRVPSALCDEDQGALLAKRCELEEMTFGQVCSISTTHCRWRRWVCLDMSQPGKIPSETKCGGLFHEPSWK